MSNFLPIICLLILLLIPSSYPAQEIRFERIPDELGLSQNYISALQEDAEGYLWVGTKDGLNRFDGYRFRVFQHNPFDSTTLSDNFVQAILEDTHGRLWIGTSTGLNWFDRRSETFRHLRLAEPPPEPRAATEVAAPDRSHQFITCLLEDKEGAIWVGTNRGGIFKMELPPEAENFTAARFTLFRSTATDQRLPGNRISGMALDEAGTLWVRIEEQIGFIRPLPNGGYRIGGFPWEDFASAWPDNHFDDFTYVVGGKTVPDHRFHSLYSAPDGKVWIKTAGGLARWDTRKKSFPLFSIDPAYVDQGERPLAEINKGGLLDRSGRWWLYGTSGFVVYDTTRQALLLRHHLAADLTLDLPRTGIPAMLEDRVGNIWLGTSGHGLYRYNPQLVKFTDNGKNVRWLGSSIRSIYQTADGQIWLGTVNLRLLHYDPATGRVEPAIPDELLARVGLTQRFSTIAAMQEDATGNLWLGGSQLVQLIRKNGRVVDLKIHPVTTADPKRTEDRVVDLHLDKDQQLWVLTYRYFGRFDRASGTFDRHDYLSMIRGEEEPGTYPCIAQQPDGTFWIGTNNGLLRFDPDTEQLAWYPCQPDAPNGLSYPKIKTIYPDPQDPDCILWIGTGGGGLNRFDLSSETFTHYRKQEGLPDEVVYGILGDQAGYLWLSTNQGLSRFYPPTGNVRNYEATNGLQGQEFNSKAFHQGRDGRLFFGGVNGFNGFDPASIEDSDYRPTIKITGFLPISTSTEYFDPTDPLTRPLLTDEHLVLSWRDKMVTFEFAALDLTAPDHNQYAYRLLGYQDKWLNLGRQRTVTLTNLRSGSYTLQVKGSNHDRVWNESFASLPITVRPPWWRSWWAYLLYTSLLAGGAYLLYRDQLNRELATAEAHRLIELTQQKSRFYTTITHELRTPLTLILGLTEQPVDENARKIIRRNGKKLLQLINQVLDLSKLTQRHSTVYYQSIEVVSWLGYLCESFTRAAEEKGIQLRIDSAIEPLSLDMDVDKMQQVVSNLLDNAIKFTTGPGSITVQLSRQTDRLLLRVTDTGCGISPQALPRIFDRFYQEDNAVSRSGQGTGIGLALVKEWVELLQGSVLVISEVGKGTTFQVQLPIRQQALAAHPPRSRPAETNAPTSVPPAPVPAEQESLPVLLLIEDNPDVVGFIGSLLRDRYRIEVAPDGQAGIERAVATIPDIIVSDVMMPRVDGLAVVATLKKDFRTCHIPILLLTAKASHQDRVAGLKIGADAYLKKPFHSDELIVRLEKLIEMRRELQVHYTRSPAAENGNGANEPPVALTLDDLFLQQLRQFIDTHLANAELTVAQLGHATLLSPAQLFRKMKALTGEPPMSYVRKVRLNEAMRLLQHSDRNVAEIAYRVGFNDPNYFSRAFSKEFGAAPSDFRN